MRAKSGVRSTVISSLPESRKLSIDVLDRERSGISFETHVGKTRDEFLMGSRSCTDTLLGSVHGGLCASI